jgi:hypothetical protein
MRVARSWHGELQAQRRASRAADAERRIGRRRIARFGEGIKADRRRPARPGRGTVNVARRAASEKMPA